MKYKNDLVFSRATIRPQEYDFIYSLCKINNIKTVLEFGTGISTYCFLENDCYIMSYETDKQYVPDGLYKQEKCEIILYNYDNLDNMKSDKMFDLAFIDGPRGLEHLSRFKSCLFAVSCTNHVLMHDFCRLGEQETASYFVKMYDGWKLNHLKTEVDMGYLYSGQSLILPSYHGEGKKYFPQ